MKKGLGAQDSGRFGDWLVGRWKMWLLSVSWMHARAHSGRRR